MKPAENLGRAAQIAIAALVILGMVGGSLIIAHTGFETSPKTRGAQPVFVPFPEAYLMVAPMYGQSLIGMLVLLRARKTSKIGIFLGIFLFASVASILVSVWR
ncbi:MAG: hypothetical protein WBK51_11960 [Polaromonas sp.]